MMGLVADGEFLCLDALDFRIDDLPEVEQCCCLVASTGGRNRCLPVGPDQEAADHTDAVLEKPRKRRRR